MEVRERIIEKATKLFFRYGIRNVTMDDLAVELGISKRTVYENFKDKTELVECCMDELFILRKNVNSTIINESDNIIQAIFTITKEGIKVMGTLNPVFFYDLKKYYPAIWKKTSDQNRNYSFNLWHTMLRKGINEGVIRKDIDIPIVSKLFHLQIDFIADETVFPRDEFDILDVFKNMSINFTRGISTKKGIDIIEQISL